MSFNPCPPGQPPAWLPGEQLLVSQNGVDLKLQLGRSGPTQAPQSFKASVWGAVMSGAPRTGGDPRGQIPSTWA